MFCQRTVCPCPYSTCKDDTNNKKQCHIASKSKTIGDGQQKVYFKSQFNKYCDMSGNHRNYCGTNLRCDGNLKKCTAALKELDDCNPNKMECEDGLSCDITVSTCFKSQFNKYCDMSGNHRNYCGTNLRCDGNLKKCTAALKELDDCNPNKMECEDGLSCDITDSTCKKDMGTTCTTTSECADALVCDSTSTSKNKLNCVPAFKEMDKCTPSKLECAVRLTCDTTLIIGRLPLPMRLVPDEPEKLISKVKH